MASLMVVSALTLVAAIMVTTGICSGSGEPGGGDEGKGKKEWELADRMLPRPMRIWLNPGDERWKMGKKTVICIHDFSGVQAGGGEHAMGRITAAATRLSARIPSGVVIVVQSGREEQGADSACDDPGTGAGGAGAGGGNAGWSVVRLRMLDSGGEGKIVGQVEGSYSLRVLGGEASILILARDDRGLFYGMCTLEQMIIVQAQEDVDRSWALSNKVWPSLLGSSLLDVGTTLPSVEIQDWPGIANRGIMLDVSRNRVHSIPTLRHVADILSSLKMTELQLYTEHTFEYPGHEAVWGGTGALSALEVLELSRYCHERFISLVPNQQSLGHMQNWLKHEAYKHLAEDPRGSDHLYNGDYCCCSWDDDQYMPYSLASSRSLDFISSLYDGLLPSFPHSRSLNVGLDETFDLVPRPGMPRRDGLRASYLDHLLGLHALAGKHNRTLQFWGDMVSSDIGALRRLPRDVVLMEWGYESGSPFAEKGALYSTLGVRYYVCPGTSSWNSIAGRSENTLVNIYNAGVAAARHGAEGMLLTDWGDNGHLQPLTVSYLGVLAAADFSWNIEAAEAIMTSPPAAALKHFSSAISRLLLADPTGVSGKVLVEAGGLFRRAGRVPISNRSPLFNIVVLPNARSSGPSVQFGYEATKHGLETSLELVAGMQKEVRGAKIGADEGGLVMSELRWVLKLLEIACRIGLLCVGANVRKCDYAAHLPKREAKILGGEVGVLAQELEGLWLQRAKAGKGLADSQKRLRHTASLLSGETVEGVDMGHDDGGEL